jgi:hypothetical protein
MKRGLVSGRGKEFFFVALSVNRPGGGGEVDHTPSTAEVNAWSYIATRHTTLSALLNYGLVQIFTFTCMTTSCSRSAVRNLR